MLCWWASKLVQLLWKTSWRFLKKLKIKPRYDSSIPLSGIYPKQLNSGSQRVVYIAALFTIVKT